MPSISIILVFFIILRSLKKFLGNEILFSRRCKCRLGKGIGASWYRRKREKRSFIMIFSPIVASKTEEETCPPGYPSWQEHP